jgi:Xaa-Pro aminopeptidase
VDGDGGNGQWLTYDQVADVRGTSRDAVIRWVQRRRLRRQLGNDGRVLVLVPPSVVADVGAPRTPQRNPRGDVSGVGDNAPPNAPPDMVEVWRAAIDALRSQLGRADQREDALRAELEQIRVQARDAEETARMAQEAAEAMQTAIDELKVGQTLMVDRHATELAQAQEAASIATNALNAARRAEEARKARGLVARLRAAWRGE